GGQPDRAGSLARHVEADRQAQAPGSPQEGEPRPQAQLRPGLTAAVPPPPPARRDDVVDVVHGVEVPDPYRWLEDGEGADTRAWVVAQNDRTRAVLDALPGREDLVRRYAE